MDIEYGTVIILNLDKKKNQNILLFVISLSTSAE